MRQCGHGIGPEWPWLPQSHQCPGYPRGYLGFPAHEPGDRPGAGADVRGAGPAPHGTAGRAAPRPARRPDRHPRLGGAHDARCRGRRPRDAAHRLRRGEPGTRAHPHGRGGADGGAGARPVPRTGRRRRRGGARRVRAPFGHAEHPLLALRADDADGGARAQRRPVGRAARRRAPAFLRTGRRRRRAVARGARRGSRAGALLRRLRGGRVRAARRGVPARRRDPDAAGLGLGLESRLGHPRGRHRRHRRPRRSRRSRRSRHPHRWDSARTAERTRPRPAGVPTIRP